MGARVLRPSASASNSSGINAVSMAPRKKFDAKRVLSPRRLTATSSASSVAATRRHSDAGSACAKLPQNAPRTRIG